jgi:hypothetical protein
VLHRPQTLNVRPIKARLLVPLQAADHEVDQSDAVGGRFGRLAQGEQDQVVNGVSGVFGVINLVKPKGR